MLRYRPIKACSFWSWRGCCWWWWWWWDDDDKVCKWRYSYVQCSPIAERAFASPKIARLRPFVLLATVTCRWKWVRSIGGKTLVGKGRRTWRKPIPVSLCQSQTSQRVIYDRIRAFEVRVWSLTAWNMARPRRLRLEYVVFINSAPTLILSVIKTNNTEENPCLLRQPYTSQKRNSWVQVRLFECLIG